MNNTRRVEWAKTALIVLLVASALFLGWQTRLFNDMLRAMPIFGRATEFAVGLPEPAVAAARPLVIVITDEYGGRYGIRYDTARRNTVYNATSGILGEAIGSKSESVEISEAEWRKALSGPGVYFEYIRPVMLSVLDVWFGARMQYYFEDVSLRRIFVAFGEDTNRLYFEDYYTGRFFGADTVSPGGRAQDFMNDSNGAVFAFETGIDAAEHAPYMLIMPEPDNGHPIVRAVNTASQEDQLQIVLAAFGLSGEPTYSADDGTLVSVGTHFNIRIETNGRVIYRSTEITDVENFLTSDSEMIERARLVTYEILGGTRGISEIFFETLERGYSETYFITFGYYLAGGRVHVREDGFAARFAFIEGIITEAELYFMEFEFTGEYMNILPGRQSLAAAGGEFMLNYFYVGNERFEPVRVKYGF